METRAAQLERIIDWLGQCSHCVTDRPQPEPNVSPEGLAERLRTEILPLARAMDAELGGILGQLRTAFEEFCTEAAAESTRRQRPSIRKNDAVEACRPLLREARYRLTRLKLAEDVTV